MKKGLLILLLPLVLVSCSANNSGDSGGKIDFTPINEEIKKTFNYFKDTTNLEENSAGYGLVQDRFTNKFMSSIAATGFGLASYPIYVEEKLMNKEEAIHIVSKTLDTLLRIQQDEEASYGGCLAHFVHKYQATRLPNSEISTIDTAICLSGAIVASEYFKGETTDKVNTFWSNVDFNKFKNGNYISMGVKDPKNPKEQIGRWDYYAEHLMIYLLGAGNPNEDNRISSFYYDHMRKVEGKYDDYKFIQSWFGSLFTYQFAQSFFNFDKYEDENGINWYQNSVEASKAAYKYCVDNKERVKTFSENSWGLTACDTPKGYNGFLGTPPRGWVPDAKYYEIEGTVSPCAALGSMPFTPKESMDALKYYQEVPNLNHEKYGLKDSFNSQLYDYTWVDEDFIGIDKGISILQLYNYKNPNFISNLGGNNKYIKEGFKNNNFKLI